MNELPQTKNYHIGMRNVKTAIAATLCALLYFVLGSIPGFPFDRNPTFACIGAIFGMGVDIGNSWVSGGNRFFGTIIGGFIGMALFRVYICFYPQGGMHLLLMALLFVGVLLLIVACRIFRWPGGIQPGGVVLCIILFNTPVDTYVSYALNRIFDTAVGVLLALAVNWLLPRERILRWLHRDESK